MRAGRQDSRARTVGEREVELGEGEGQRASRGRASRAAPRRRARSFGLGVGGVVGGDGVEGAVGQAGLHRLDVGLGAQRRVHLEHRVVAGAGVVGEGKW